MDGGAQRATYTVDRGNGISPRKEQNARAVLSLTPPDQVHVVQKSKYPLRLTVKHKNDNRGEEGGQYLCVARLPPCHRCSRWSG